MTLERLDEALWAAYWRASTRPDMATVDRYLNLVHAAAKLGFEWWPMSPVGTRLLRRDL